MSFRGVVGKGLLAVAAVAVSVIAAADARSGSADTCLPPAYVSRAIRGADRVDLVRLGPPGECESNSLDRDRDAGCFVGFVRAESFHLFPDNVGMVCRMLANRNLACSTTGKGTGPACTVGFDVLGESGAVRVLLRLPSGEVEFEIPNGRRFVAVLTPSGLREWHRFVHSVAERMGRRPEELEEDLARDLSPAPVVAAPGTAPPSTAAPQLHPVVPEVVAVAITKVSPAYPDIAREAGVDGVVTLSALVGTDGRVHDTRVLKSIPMLDAAARAAVMQWSFQPGMCARKAVDSWCDVPVEFSLHD